MTKTNKKNHIFPCQECTWEWYCLVCNLITVTAYYFSNRCSVMLSNVIFNYRKLCLTNPRKAIAQYKSTRILVAYSKKQSLCTNYIVSRWVKHHKHSVNEYGIRRHDNTAPIMFTLFVYVSNGANSSGRAVSRVGLRSLACWDCGFESYRGMDSAVSVVCCQVEISASGWSLIQRSTTESDRETSIMSRPWPTRSCCATEEKRR